MFRVLPFYISATQQDVVTKVLSKYNITPSVIVKADCIQVDTFMIACTTPFSDLATQLGIQRIAIELKMRPVSPDHKLFRVLRLGHILLRIEGIKESAILVYFSNTEILIAPELCFPYYLFLARNSPLLHFRTQKEYPDGLTFIYGFLNKNYLSTTTNLYSEIHQASLNSCAVYYKDEVHYTVQDKQQECLSRLVQGEERPQ